MSKGITISQNNDIWTSAFISAIKGQNPVCPICAGKSIAVEKKVIKDDVGYMLLTCNDCGESGYLSRVVFKKDYLS